MNVYMVRNTQTGEWFKRGSRYGSRCWTNRQNVGAIWTNRNGPSAAKGGNPKEKHLMEIVEFELVEL